MNNIVQTAIVAVALSFASAAAHAQGPSRPFQFDDLRAIPGNTFPCNASTAQTTMDVCNMYSSAIVPLTDGSTIPVPAAGSGTFSITLTGNGHQFVCPSNLSNSVVQWFTFIMTQGGTGNNQPTWDTCYGFPNRTPPVLTRDSGAVDAVTCFSTSASSVMCGYLVPAIGYGVLPRSNHVRSATNCGTGAGDLSSCTATIANSVTGDLRVVGLFYGKAGGAVSTDISGVTDNHGNNCTRATGTFKTIPAGIRATDIWYCPITTGATSSVVTASFGVGQDYAEVHVAEVLGAAASPDAGIGNGASGTAASAAVTSNGVITQIKQYVFVMFKGEGTTGPTTPGVGLTLLDCDRCAITGPTSPNFDGYKLSSVVGNTIGGAATLSGTTGGWAMSIAAFLHR